MDIKEKVDRIVRMGNEMFDLMRVAAQETANGCADALLEHGFTDTEVHFGFSYSHDERNIIANITLKHPAARPDTEIETAGDCLLTHLQDKLPDGTDIKLSHELKASRPVETVVN